MNRDHLLGWPAALLALDPEPKVVPPRTIPRPPQLLTEAEQHTRAKQDQTITSQLPVLGIKAKPEEKIQYFVRNFNNGHQDAYQLTPDGALWYWKRSGRRWNKSKWTAEQALALFTPIRPVDTKPSWVTADA